MPLLEGLDGVEKMSKSKNNYIGITEDANTMFAKTLSISDEQMWRWYTLLSFRPETEIAALKAGWPLAATEGRQGDAGQGDHRPVPQSLGGRCGRAELPAAPRAGCLTRSPRSFLAGAPDGDRRTAWHAPVWCPAPAKACG